jgi:hypothetical protein
VAEEAEELNSGHARNTIPSLKIGEKKANTLDINVNATTSGL